MREIKFRAWDSESKVMRHDAQDQYDYTSVPNGEIGWETSFGTVLDDPRYEVMQFTGLKDRNGKDIYEGDIVLNEYGHACEMVFRHHGFYYTRPNWKSRIAHPTDGKLEIIGNIYLDSELLKEGK